MKQWKRVSGVVLSGILALSMTLGGMTAPDAGAKAKKAKLKTKKISVTVGKKKTIKIANKKKSCKYTFKSNKKKVAKVSKKGVVTGQKKGTAKDPARADPSALSSWQGTGFRPLSGAV